MRGKAALLTGLGAGYLLGTKAGRERYRQIVTRARDVWSSGKVQGAVDTVTGTAADVVAKVRPKAAGQAQEAASKVAEAAHRSASEAAANSDDPRPDGSGSA